FRLALCEGCARLAPGISEEFEWPRRRHGRVELAPGARREIARIGEDLLAGGRALGVERHKRGALHIDFAADLDDLRPAAGGELFRHGLQRADVDGDILAGNAVAARRTEHESAILVAQRRRKTVDLWLGHD